MDSLATRRTTVLGPLRLFLFISRRFRPDRWSREGYRSRRSPGLLPEPCQQHGHRPHHHARGRADPGAVAPRAGAPPRGYLPECPALPPASARAGPLSRCRLALSVRTAADASRAVFCGVQRALGVRGRVRPPHPRRALPHPRCPAPVWCTDRGEPRVWRWCASCWALRPAGWPGPASGVITSPRANV